MPFPPVASLKRLTNDVATPRIVNIIKKIGLELLSFLSIKLLKSLFSPKSYKYFYDDEIKNLVDIFYKKDIIKYGFTFDF